MAPSGDGSGERGPGQPAGPHQHEGLPAPGDVIAAKYQVERVLGVGGMGVVLAARHLQLGQRVAIKFMVEAFAQDARAVERFVREARAAVALSSEHVARVIDVGTLESGAPYMVMEYLTGRDLSEVLRSGGPLDVSRAVDLVLQACDGVAEAHAIGIIHRDLKPSNLFVTSRRDGSPLVKVLDFGISKATGGGPGASQTLTDSGMVMGSPLYMSPEQARSAKSADARSDVWALGVIVYQLLVGKTPFEGDTLGETLARILSEDAPPLRQRRPDAPAGLDAAVARCLERDLRRRVQSVTELAQLLTCRSASRGERALLVERLSRSSPNPRVEPPSATAIAADGPGGAAPPHIFVRRRPTRGRAEEETGQPWLRSGRGHETAARRPMRRVLAWAAGALILGAGGPHGRDPPGQHPRDRSGRLERHGGEPRRPRVAPPVVQAPPPTHAPVATAEELAPPEGEEQATARSSPIAPPPTPARRRSWRTSGPPTLRRRARVRRARRRLRLLPELPHPRRPARSRTSGTELHEGKLMFVRGAVWAFLIAAMTCIPGVRREARNGRGLLRESRGEPPRRGGRRGPVMGPRATRHGGPRYRTQRYMVARTAPSPVARLSGARLEGSDDRARSDEQAGGVALSEWYVRRPRGVEQGWTLKENPCAGGEARLEVEVRGLSPSPSPDGESVILRDAGGATRLLYTDLWARDADGTALEARMTVTGDAIDLTVDTRHAKFPVVVDPLVWASQKIQAGDLATAGPATFGFSIAVSGTAAFIGAPGAKIGASAAQGAVYVFASSGGTWTQQQQLFASDPTANDRFGSGVALSGSTLVVGAHPSTGPGAAYVFTLSNGAWAVAQKLTASDAASGDLFGAASEPE